MSTLQKSNERIDWDDLKLVLEIDRQGSLSGAARALGVQHSTVFRRLDQLETGLRTKLFERHRQGYVSNARGEALVAAARQMETAVLAAQRRVAGADAQPAGLVQIATSEAIDGFLLVPLLRDFATRYPQIELEVRTENRSVDLGRHEADLALRATSQPPESLIGRKLTTLTMAVYASRELAATLQGSSLEKWPWLGFDASLSNGPQARFLRESLPTVRPELRFDSVVASAQATRNSLGVSALPCFLAASMPDVVRIAEIEPRFFTDLWLLHHPDLRHNARIRAITQFLTQQLPEHLETVRQLLSTRESGSLP